MRILKYNVVKKPPPVSHHVHYQNWPLEQREVSPSHEAVICSNYQRHSLAKQGTVCTHLKFQILPTKHAAEERSGTQFICHQRKVMFAFLLGFRIRSRSKRWIFLFDLLPNYSSVGTMGMKNSLKILTRYVLFGEQASRCKCIKANASCPCKGTFVE